jgi:energy-coupling factor transporter ATP-binding protein EcfA2
MQKASRINEIYQLVDPEEPISRADPRYVDLSSARGDEDFARYILRRVRNSRPGQYHCHLVTGHRGCGKSTELLSLKAELEKERFLVAYVDAYETLDIADVEYLDVLIAVITAWTELAREHGLPVRQELVKDIERWFAETELVEVHTEEGEISAAGGAELKAEIPFLARLFMDVRSQLRSGDLVRKEVRQKIERRLSDFLDRTNLLLDQIGVLARQRGYAGLVTIVDNLEKIPLKLLDAQSGLTNHAAIFVEHAEALKAPHSHLIYTVPVTLLNDRNLGMAYPDLDMLPMVKIIAADGSPYPPGIKLLEQVIRQRVDVEAVFSDPNALKELIRMSGGVLRDLFRLILFATDYAPEDGKIEAGHIQRAIRKLIREYDLLIHEEDLEVLKKILRNPHPPSSNRLARLMYNRLVLPYQNQEPWVAVHPAVRESPTFQKADLETS